MRRVRTYSLSKWDQRFLNLAESVSTWSDDPRMKVGTAVVGDANVLLSSGFNGLVRGVDDGVSARLDTGAHKDHWVEHAERNAIFNAARTGTSLANSRFYCTHFPCAPCARGIIQSGAFALIAGTSPDPAYIKYVESWRESLTMFYEAGVVVIAADNLSCEIPANGISEVEDQVHDLLKKLG